MSDEEGALVSAMLAELETAVVTAITALAESTLDALKSVYASGKDAQAVERVRAQVTEALGNRTPGTPEDTELEEALLAELADD
jgi:cysteine sulfinate desulfinase/cysteine desulfurase-like protein